MNVFGGNDKGVYEIEGLDIEQSEMKQLADMWAKALTGRGIDSEVNNVGDMYTSIITDEVSEDANLITIEDVEVVQSIGRKSVNDFTSEEITKTEDFARKYFREMGIKSPFFRAWFGDWRAKDITLIEKVILKPGNNFISSIIQNTDSNMLINISKIGRDHIRTHLHNSEFSQFIINNLREITEKAILLDSYISKPKGNTKHKNTMMMHSFYVPVEFKGKVNIVKLYVEEFYNEWNKKVQRRDYDLKNIETLNDVDRFGENDSAPLYASNNAPIDTVSDLFKIVKTCDKDFNPHECSVLLNDNGTPKVMYCAAEENTNEFNVLENGYLGKGIYFYENEDSAKGHTVADDKPAGKVYACYLNIKNPFIAEHTSDYDIETLKKQGYDGIYDPSKEVYVAFSSNQIKSATDNIGTFDGDNPDIRYSMLENEFSLTSDYENDIIYYGDYMTIIPYQMNEEDDILYSTAMWHTGLSRAQYEMLNRKIKSDIKKSQNHITDGANWIYTDIGNQTVFAIYSTSDYDDPTVLYVSKGKQAEYELNILKRIKEETEYGREYGREYGSGIYRKPGIVNHLLSSSGMQNVNHMADSNGLMGGRRGLGDVNVLQGTSKRKPRPAFKSVIRNLIQEQEQQFIMEKDSKKFPSTTDEAKSYEDALKSITMSDQREYKEDYQDSVDNQFVVDMEWLRDNCPEAFYNYILDDEEEEDEEYKIRGLMYDLLINYSHLAG